MALDTGATYTIIPYEAAQLAGLNPIRAKEQIEIVMGGGINDLFQQLNKLFNL